MSAYPLRRIVSEGVNEHGVQTETLECGHTIHRKRDIYGHTNAYRRRCRHCRRDAELLADRLAAIKRLHCMLCYDVIKSAPKQEPCECRCHR